jgi:hypothetical protein
MEYDSFNKEVNISATDLTTIEIFRFNEPDRQQQTSDNQ